MTDRMIFFVIGAILGILAFGLGYRFYDAHNWRDVGCGIDGKVIQYNADIDSYRQN